MTIWITPLGFLAIGLLLAGWPVWKRLFAPMNRLLSVIGHD